MRGGIARNNLVLSLHWQKTYILIKRVCSNVMNSLTQKVLVCFSLLLLPSAWEMYNDVTLIWYISYHTKRLWENEKKFYRSLPPPLPHSTLPLLFLNRLPRTPLLANWKAFPLKFVRKEIHCTCVTLCRMTRPSSINYGNQGSESSVIRRRANDGSDSLVGPQLHRPTQHT